MDYYLYVHLKNKAKIKLEFVLVLHMDFCFMSFVIRTIPFITRTGKHKFSKLRMVDLLEKLTRIGIMKH